jgi:hypothetical protein
MGAKIKEPGDNPFSVRSVCCNAHIESYRRTLASFSSQVSDAFLSWRLAACSLFMIDLRTYNG